MTTTILHAEIDWRALGEALRRPFDPADIDFRPQGKTSAGAKCQVVCYIDARAVADRLDEVVGPGAWSFAYTPLVIERGEVQLAKGALTIHGVTKEDIGDASNFEASKGCVSDALKRAAVLWGIGRYLYGLGTEWVTLDQHQRISPADLQRLRAKLPRPEGAQAAAPKPTEKQPTPAAEAAEAAKRWVTPDQWSRLLKATELLGKEMPEPGTLSYEEAETLLHTYMEDWKRVNQKRMPRGEATHATV